jgi:predicted GNAT superfamily acetyltransferase
LQAEIWGSRSVAAPSTILRAISVAGGVVLLARAGDRPVGFVYGFTGRTRDGAVYHRSHAAGVLSEFRGSGIGSALKLAQGREVLALGLDRVVWTFDPTQLGNAYFNLRHLGATARAFQRDFYGNRDDALSHGLPTDRLFVEWFLGSRERADLAKLRRHPAASSINVPAGLPAPPGTDPAKVLPLQDGLRRQLEAAYLEGLQIIDFDADSRRYLLAELPSWFPSPAEGGSVSEG